MVYEMGSGVRGLEGGCVKFRIQNGQYLRSDFINAWLKEDSRSK